jgi:hypothetical protein
VLPIGGSPKKVPVIFAQVEFYNADGEKAAKCADRGEKIVPRAARSKLYETNLNPEGS